MFRLISPRGDELATCGDMLTAMSHLREAACGGRILDEHGTTLAKRLTAAQALRIADEETKLPEEDDGAV